MDMQIGAIAMSMSNISKGEPSAGLRHLDPDTDFKVRRITSCINEAIHMATNEPTLGLYRIREHVHRTLPQLATKKKDMKSNNKRIEETSYDLNLSMEVVDSMKGISNFIRIQEALKTAIETKKILNSEEEQERARMEMDLKNARIANRSISCNEPAEGYICPVCYFALPTQDQLSSHWHKEHNLRDCESEMFQEVDIPAGSTVTIRDETLRSDASEILPTSNARISECEDIVKNLVDSSRNY